MKDRGMSPGEREVRRVLARGGTLHEQLFALRRLDLDDVQLLRVLRRLDEESRPLTPTDSE